MRKQEELLVGLDIGMSKVCAVAAQPSTEDALRILGFSQVRSDGVRNGVVVSIEKTVRAIRQAVRDCELMCGMPITQVQVGMSGQHIKGANEHGMVTVQSNRTVEAEDVARAVEAAQAVPIPSDRDVLHVLPREFTLDDQKGIQNPIGMSGIRLEVNVHIITCSTTAVRNLVKCCELAGIDTVNVSLAPLASAEATMSDDERELGVAVVDIGSGSTDIVVFSGGSVIHSCVLPLGGGHVTNDIAVGASTPLSDAEDLKHGHGVALMCMAPSKEGIQTASVGGGRARSVTKRMLAEIIEARMREIFELTQVELERSGKRHLLACGVILTGGSSLLPGVDELAAETLHTPVRIGLPLHVTGMAEMIHSPVHTTGVGLLRCAQRELENQNQPWSLTRPAAFQRASKRMWGWMSDLF